MSYSNISGAAFIYASSCHGPEADRSARPKLTLARTITHPGRLEHGPHDGHAPSVQFNLVIGGDAGDDAILVSGKR